MDTMFSKWVLHELEISQISQAELARRANITPAAVSDMLSGRRGIGYKLAVSIALAFDYPPEFGLRKAGLLPPSQNSSPLVDRIMHMVAQLPDDEIEDLTYMVEAKLEKISRKEQRKKLKEIKDTP